MHFVVPASQLRSPRPNIPHYPARLNAAPHKASKPRQTAQLFSLTTSVMTPSDRLAGDTATHYPVSRVTADITQLMYDVIGNSETRTSCRREADETQRVAGETQARRSELQANLGVPGILSHFQSRSPPGSLKTLSLEALPARSRCRKLQLRRPRERPVRIRQAAAAGRLEAGISLRPLSARLDSERSRSGPAARLTESERRVRRALRQSSLRHRCPECVNRHCEMSRRPETGK